MADHYSADATRNALSPVLDWYQSDETSPRPTLEIVADVVADLQTDRAALLRIQRLAQDAIQLSSEGHPISAVNVSREVINIIMGRGI